MKRWASYWHSCTAKSREPSARSSRGISLAIRSRFWLRSPANHSPWALVGGSTCRVLLFLAATVAANPYMPAPYLVSPQAMVTVLRARGLPFAEEEIPDGSR